MKLCTYQLNNGLCGEPSTDSRCEQHPYPELTKPSREKRGYNDAWRKLSKRARELQPWCSDCGTTEDLTADHLQWPATTLKHVDVLCRSCNARKGAPTEENDPRRNYPGGKTLKVSLPNPRGQAFTFTQFDNDSHVGGGVSG